jgi:hypothetical protein
MGVNSATIRSQRAAAGVFLAVTAPLAIAIAVSGGFVALAPLLLLVLPILATGRAPGMRTLERVRRRLAIRHRGPRELAPKPASLIPDFRIPGLLHAGPLAGRGPPVDGLTGRVQPPPGAGVDRLASLR